MRPGRRHQGGEPFEGFDGPLSELLSIRTAMAETADERFCAAMWTGAYVWDMVAAPILYLPSSRQRRLPQITAAAELAEIQNRPPKRPPPDEATLKPAIRMLFKDLRPGDAGVLLAAFRSPLEMTTREQCRATRLFHRRLKEMTRKDALVVFRSTLYADTGSGRPE